MRQCISWRYPCSTGYHVIHIRRVWEVSKVPHVKVRWRMARTVLFPGHIFLYHGYRKTEKPVKDMWGVIHVQLDTSMSIPHAKSFLKHVEDVSKLHMSTRCGSRDSKRRLPRTFCGQLYKLHVQDWFMCSRSVYGFITASRIVKSVIQEVL